MPDKDLIETRESPLKAILIQALCKKCGGNLVMNSMALPVIPPQYPHTCEKCGDVINLSGKYPAVEHRLVE